MYSSPENYKNGIFYPFFYSSVSITYWIIEKRITAMDREIIKQLNVHPLPYETGILTLFNRNIL